MGSLSVLNELGGGGGVQKELQADLNTRMLTEPWAERREMALTEPQPTASHRVA